MSIGTGIVLFVIGAILAFAVNIQVEWANLDMIGYILMGAGVVVFIIGLVFLFRRRQTNTVTQTSIDPASGAETTRRSTSAREDPADL